MGVAEVPQKPGEAKDTEMLWWAVRALGEAEGVVGSAVMWPQEKLELWHTHTLFRVPAVGNISRGASF